MSNNTDTVLTQLAQEVNELEAQRTGGNQRKTIEMGHKLIAIRQILREVNGESNYQKALDGRPPVGWGVWAKHNLSISVSHAAVCIQYVLDPDARARKTAQVIGHQYTPRGALERAKRAWPNWTHEQREQFSTGVLQLLKSA